jgi:hypothetical protein
MPIVRTFLPAFGNLLTSLGRGIKEAIAYHLAKYTADESDQSYRTSAYFPQIVWMCDNDFVANHVFALCEQAVRIRREEGHSATGAALLTSHMNTQEIDMSLKTGIHDYKSVLVAVPSQLQNQIRHGNVDLSKVQRIVIGNATMILAQSSQKPIEKFLNGLLPKHSIVALFSEASFNAGRSWRGMTSGFGRPLSKMSLFVDNNQRLLSFIGRIITWEAFHGPTRNLPRYSLGKRRQYGAQRVLILCERRLLMHQVQSFRPTSREQADQAASSGPTIFNCRIPVAVQDYCKSLSEKFIERFDSGEVKFLLTDQYYIHGYDYKFLPVMFFIHIPDQFDELLSMFQWYEASIPLLYPNFQADLTQVL